MLAGGTVNPQRIAMSELRPPSPRPGFLVDQTGGVVFDPATATQVGVPNPLVGARIVKALPMAWTLIQRPTFVVDARARALADPAADQVGRNWVWVNRMVSATRTEETRRQS